MGVSFFDWLLAAIGILILILIGTLLLNLKEYEDRCYAPRLSIEELRQRLKY